MINEYFLNFHLLAQVNKLLDTILLNCFLFRKDLIHDIMSFPRYVKGHFEKDKRLIMLLKLSEISG